MRRLLMVCYHFPPLGGIASLRALRFARHLPETGWEPVVLTPARGRYVLDAGLGWAGRTERTATLEPRRTSHAVSGSSPGGASTGLATTLRRALSTWLYFPDGHVGWYPFALQAGRRLLHERRFDAIFSSAYPVTAHLVARQLKRESGLPWVAEFRDLWTDWSPAQGRRREREHRLEASLLADTDAIVATSETHASVLQLRAVVPARAITNGFDPETYEPATSSTCGEPSLWTVVYLGTYYPGVQELDTALAGLALAREQRRLPPFRLRFIGTDVGSLRPSLARHGLADLVEEAGFLPQAAAARLLAGSDLALLGGPIFAPDATRVGWIPAKVFEYLGSGLPVVMVGDPRAEVARLLGRLSRCRVVPTGDVAGAARAFEALQATPRSPRGVEIEAFTSRQLTRSLAELLDGMASHRCT